MVLITEYLIIGEGDILSGMFINFCECKLNTEKAIIHKTEFIDKDWFKSLRDTNPNFTFYREGNSVYFWNPISDDAVKNIGAEYIPVDISLFTHPKIFSRMLEDKIITIFRGVSKYNIFRNKYSNTWEIVSNENLFEDVGLEVFRAVNFNTYYSSNGEKTILGFCLSTKLKNHFKWGKQDFINNGIACADLAGKDNIIFANKAAIKRYIEARGLEKQYNTKISTENELEKEFQVIKKTMKWVSNKLVNTQLYKDVIVEQCELKYLPFDENMMQYSIIPRPKRYYLNDIEGVGGRYDEQLKKFHPYSSAIFRGKRINIFVLTPRIYEGTVSDLLKKLKNNLSDVFQLNQLNFELGLIEGVNLSDYEKAMYDRKFNNIDLALIVVSETHWSLPVEKSPYYFCKAKYIGQGIPTQVVQIEKIKSSNLEYIVRNLSLSIYAKLGGTPWGIEKTEHLKKEFIIGIGSTVNEQKKTVMGIANIFDFTGKYFVGECVPLSGFDDYADKLEELLYEQLKELIGEYSDEVRLIFHIFKSPSNRYELKALSNVINRLNGKEIKYAFVHVGYGHNFRLFNNDGKENVNKGFYINISENEALISFVDKSSVPLRITVDKRSNFIDVYHLAKQIYWFSHLSCRSYMPAKKSVSILYPSLMARMTEKLKKIDGWDYDALKTVGEKLWFI